MKKWVLTDKLCLMALGIGAAALVFAPAAGADRGGWADPPGGWTFVEEWNGDIPQVEGDPKWDNNNGSDQYSGNANTALFNDFGIYIDWEDELEDGAPNPDTATLAGDVVRIETIEGAGDTEDGETPAADATVLRIVDLGDPSTFTGGEPSDRKIFFLGALHEPGELTEDPFLTGVTYAARYRIFPIKPDRDVGASLELVQLALDPDGDGEIDGDGRLRFIPEASDRAHVGVGYFDPENGDNSVLVGSGYYTAGELSILVNDEADPDGDENVPVLSDIDTTAFHSIWISAIADENDPNIINVRAFANGSTEPVETQIIRGPGAVDKPAPEDLQDNAEWSGLKELAFNIGSAGTPAAGGFQYDWLVATMAGAFDPEPAGGTPVQEWAIY